MMRSAGIAAVALLVRLAPLLWPGLLRGQLEYDDAVYFSAAQHPIAGELPYRDFLFVQPPGVAVLMTPFAWLARGVGDPNALAVARIFVCIVGAANAVLVGRLLTRFGAASAWTGGLLYAVWGAVALAERTVLLEPFLNLAVLVALTLLASRQSGELAARHARSRVGNNRSVESGAPTVGANRIAAAGLLIGLALTLKLWALADLGVLSVLVFARYRARALVPWFAGVAAAVLVVAGPWLLAAPSAAMRQIVADQLGRAADPAPYLFRFGFFRLVVATTSLPALAAMALFALLLPLLAAAVLAPLWRTVRRCEPPRLWDDLVWWALLSVAGGLLILLSPSTFYHYSAVTVPGMCLAAGAAVPGARAWLAARVPGIARLLPAALGVALVATAVSACLNVVRIAPYSAQVRAFVAKHHCTWALTQATLESSDAVTTGIERGCPGEVDAFGVALDMTRGSGEAITLDSAKRLDAWQQRVRDQLNKCDAVVLVGGLDAQPFSAQTKQTVRMLFRPAGEGAGQTLWTRK